MHDIFKNSLNPSPRQSEHHLKSFLSENLRGCITWNTQVISLNAPQSLMVTELIALVDVCTLDLASICHSLTGLAVVLDERE